MRSGKSGFLWPFVGGFVIGAIGLATLHPADASKAVANVATAAHLSR
jgi:hypothetical protein